MYRLYDEINNSVKLTNKKLYNMWLCSEKLQTRGYSSTHSCFILQPLFLNWQWPRCVIAAVASPELRINEVYVLCKYSHANWNKLRATLRVFIKRKKFAQNY